MKEIVLEIIKAGKERLKYPIITIYIIVLVLWNWELLSVYFFSSKSIEDRITYIETNYTDQWGRVLWPLAKAVFLALFIPLLMWGLEFLLHLINGGRRVIKNKNNTAVRADKLAAAQNEFYIQEARTGTKTVQEWEDKVKSLESRLNLQLETTNRHIQDLESAKDLHSREVQTLNNKLSHFDDDMFKKADDMAFKLINLFENKEDFKDNTIQHLVHGFDLVLRRESLKDNWGINTIYPPMVNNMLGEILAAFVQNNLIKTAQSHAKLTLLGATTYARLCEMLKG